MIGEFSVAKEKVNPQWLLFLPSIYTFNVYDAYARTNESNKLYEMEMARFLKNNYQRGDIRNLYIEKGG
ncbi:MAG: hypothetical protein LRY73_19235 [Bacillus sp. (in: Bacteria)]|nr:hypothetical protein [Bacillus sp. (in: firmicutes)]